jgi:hypothetical protein
MNNVMHVAPVRHLFRWVARDPEAEEALSARLDEIDARFRPFVDNPAVRAAWLGARRPVLDAWQATWVRAPTRLQRIG